MPSLSLALLGEVREERSDEGGGGRADATRWRMPPPSAAGRAGFDTLGNGPFRVPVAPSVAACGGATSSVCGRPSRVRHSRQWPVSRAGCPLRLRPAAAATSPASLPLGGGGHIGGASRVPWRPLCAVPGGPAPAPRACFPAPQTQVAEPASPFCALPRRSAAGEVPRSPRRGGGGNRALATPPGKAFSSPHSSRFGSTPPTRVERASWELPQSPPAAYGRSHLLRVWQAALNRAVPQTGSRDAGQKSEPEEAGRVEVEQGSTLLAMARFARRLPPPSAAFGRSHLPRLAAARRGRAGYYGEKPTGFPVGFSLWSGRPDLNRRPHRPERCALPSCATSRSVDCTPYETIATRIRSTRLRSI